MNVLLVDDEAGLRKLAKLMLESGGFRVLDAPNGAEAIELSQEHSIDVLVTDVVMEDLGGFDLAQTLVERHPIFQCYSCPGIPCNFTSRFPDRPSSKSRFGRGT